MYGSMLTNCGGMSTTASVWSWLATPWVSPKKMAAASAPMGFQAPKIYKAQVKPATPPSITADDLLAS